MTSHRDYHTILGSEPLSHRQWEKILILNRNRETVNHLKLWKACNSFRISTFNTYVN